jgi:hypothetical protein
MQASQVQKWQPSLHSQKQSGAAFPTMQACISALPDSPHLFSSTTTRSQQVACTGPCPTWPTTATPPTVAALRRSSPARPEAAAPRRSSPARPAAAAPRRISPTKLAVAAHGGARPAVVEDGEGGTTTMVEVGKGQWRREEEPGLAATTHRGVDLSSISMVPELDLSSPSSNRSPWTSPSWFPTIPSPAARRRGGGPLELGRGCGCGRRLRAVLPCFSRRRGPGRCRPPWEKE